MLNQLMTEEDVKRYLGIPDFRHASKDVLMKFVSSIPYINKDVAIKIIEQYPAYCTCAQTFVQYYSTMCDNMLKDNSKSVEATMKGYQTTLDTISALAKMENISADDRHRYAESMVFIADKISWDQEGAPPNYETLKRLAAESLDEACFFYIHDQFENKRLLMPHRWIKEAYSNLRDKLGKEKSRNE